LERKCQQSHFIQELLTLKDCCNQEKMSGAINIARKKQVTSIQALHEYPKRHERKKNVLLISLENRIVLK